VKIIRKNEKVEASSYFAVEILFKGIFGHVTTLRISYMLKLKGSVEKGTCAI